MKDSILMPLARLAGRTDLARVVAPRNPVIVLYHSVCPSDADGGFGGGTFEEHVLFLKRHFTLLGPNEVDATRLTRERVQILLTFDDGFRNNAEVVAPILRKHGVPAVFFVSSRHAQPGKYLWFSYLEALERLFRWKTLSFDGTLFDMSSAGRRRSVRMLSERLLALEPHPSAMYRAIEEELPPLEEFVTREQIANCFAGMTAEQVGELSNDPLFSVGVHTVDHPFLSRCADDEALQQITANREWLQAQSGRPCDWIAYPAGDYTPQLIDTCRAAGFTRGFAVACQSGHGSALVRSRIGIYSSSTALLAFKVQWGQFMRDVRIPVG
jgi:peptidoglycan/xylan/chitin deacetylase (PgdA/CDA1 family)